MKRIRFMLSASLLSCAIAAQPAFAQDTAASVADRSAGQELEAIIVTAERRSSDLQRTAASVSVRGGDDLKELGRYSLSQILEDVPGVSGGAASAPIPGGSGVDTASPGLTIRGIPSNSGAVGNVTSAAAAAAVYADGVFEGVGSNYDVRRVELLRGPQGTLYGRSATSGLVAVHTFDPDLSKLGGSELVEIGNYDLQHYTAVANIPMIEDRLGIRVAYNRYHQDGYYVPDGNGNGWLTSDDGKVKVLVKPTDNISLLVGAALQNNKTLNGGSTILLDQATGGYVFTPTPVGSGKNKFRQYWAELNWDLGLGTLTYQPAYRTWTSSAETHTRGATLAESIDNTIDVPRDHFTTHELRLASNAASKLKWQIGALYYKNSLSSHLVVTLPALGISPINALVRDKTTKALGAFAEATYPITDTTRVTGGIRYDHTKVSVVEDYTSITGVTQTLSGSGGRRSYENVTYKGRVEHDFTPHNMIYAMVSTGFSPGDVSVATGPTGNPYALDLKAETLTAYEVGTKNRFLNNALQVNASLFYYDYGSYQTANVNITPQLPYLTFVTLAAPAKAYGGELEVTYKIAADDRASLNLGYTYAYFTDRDVLIDAGPSVPPVTFGQFYSRKEIPNVTPFTANFSYEHVFRPINLTLRGAVRYMSAHYLANIPETTTFPTELYHIDGQFVGDVSATWQPSDSGFSITGYVRNIGDNRYNTGVFPQSTSLQAAPYTPRTYGVVLSANF